jgi:hypothetical protein
MKTLIRDGKMAALVSPGFGAGWSTWCREHEFEMLTDPDLVQLVLDGDLAGAAALAEERYEAYTGGARDLCVAWIPLGTQFVVNEYDGSESIQTKDSVGWHTAA